MSGSAARSTTTLALGALALALALTASSGTAAASSHAPILGIVPHAGLHASALAGKNTTIGSGPATYHGGQVMHTNTPYAIYWVPSGFSVSANYESLINRYFQDVAAASGSADNVYAVGTQYYDNLASIQYQSAFGGSYVDTAPFPASGCSDGRDAVCLTDQQLQSEIQKVITATGWHEGASSIFFLMTPENVGSCADQGGSDCSTNSFCAYHSDFIDTTSGQPVIYANEPYAGTDPGCTYSLVGQQGFPNDHDADATINTISHEQSEAITDPFGDAWFANDGNQDEIADLCAGNFGSTSLGTANGQPYNQLINGHPYSIQQEYSNDNGDCASGYTPAVAPSAVAAPVLSGAARLGQRLTTSNGEWSHAPSGYAYQWQRCAANGTGCANISGATASTYQLTASDLGHSVRSGVSTHNAAGTSAGFAPSATTAVVVAGVPAAKKSPRISGRARVGWRLAAQRGSWSGPPVRYRYQWLRCNRSGGSCAPIRGATHSLYRLTKRDASHRLRVRVTAINVAGAGKATSAATGRVPTSS